MTARIKICGLTRADDVALAGSLDVDAVGFVLWGGSPRAVTAADAGRLSRALPPWVARVGVFVTPSPDEVLAAVRVAGLSAVQLYGATDAAPFVALGIPVLWAASLDDAGSMPVAPPGTTLLLDAHDPVRHGGTGRLVDWARAAAVAATARLVLAGGLTPDNVGAAVAQVRPYGVDVSSGVEDAPGIKSPERVRRFVAAVRQSEAKGRA